MRGGLAERQAAIAQFSVRDAERLPDYDAMLERAADVLRDLVLTTPPNAGGGIARADQGRHARAAHARGSASMTSAAARPLHAQRRRFSRRLVRERRRQGRLRLRRHRRQLRGAVDAGHGLRAAAPLLRRGERQARRLGPRHRRHGRHHARHGVGGRARAASRSAPAPRCSEIMTADGAATGVVLDQRRGDFRARGRGQRRRRSCCSAISCRRAPSRRETRALFTGMKSGSGTFRMNVALSELPDFTCRPGTNAQDHHGSGIVIGPTLDYLERAYLDARADGWSREPVVEMLIPSTLDATLAPPGKHVASLFVQHVAPHLPDGRSWADAREKEAFADLVIDTVTRHAPNFERVGDRARRSCRRSTSSSASAWSTATFSTARCRSISSSRAPASGLCQLPHAAGGPLPVRVGRASRRRRHRRAGPQRGARDHPRSSRAGAGGADFVAYAEIGD